MEILYQDDRVLVCIKPAGVLSTDEPGGLPELIRRELGEPEANLRTVHRLDRVVSGVMVLARTSRAASDLSDQIRTGRFEKEYLAVCHGAPEGGGMEDWLYRDPVLRKTFRKEPSFAGAQPASLTYDTLCVHASVSLVRIHLITGRTHQIRAQFSGRGYPLCGDRKYGGSDNWSSIALWSRRIRFFHPRTKEPMEFSALPPAADAWEPFADFLREMR